MKDTPKIYLEKYLLAKKPSDAFKKNKTFQRFIEKRIPELIQLKGLEQPKEYHSFDVFEHTLYVIDNTRPDLILRLAAMFHDIGKISTQEIKENGKITFIRHELISSRMAKEILERLEYDEATIQTVCLLVLNHMRKLTFDDFGNYLGNNARRGLNRFVRSFGDELERGLELINADNIAQKGDESVNNIQIGGIMRALIQQAKQDAKRAKEAKAEKEKSDKSDKNSKADKTSKVDKYNRADSPNMTDRYNRASSPNKTDRYNRAGSPNKTDRYNRADNPNKIDRFNRVETKTTYSKRKY
jgi:putative nucleotidyltransferase with HDIG domain